MLSVTNISPADLANIEPTDVVSFDVTSTAGFVRIVVCVDPFNSDRAPELVHDGDAFHVPYAESTRTAVAGGYRFVLRRSGGWYAAPHPLIFAVDSAGREL